MWYKRANNQSYRDIPPNYFDLGHGMFDGSEEANQDALWVFNGHSIQSIVGEQWLASGKEGYEFTHKNTFPGLKYENMYRGRYEKETNSVSILKPSKSMQRPVPEIIISQLKKVYGENIKIEEF
jgi:hypothetical protein